MGRATERVLIDTQKLFEELERRGKSKRELSLEIGRNEAYISKLGRRNDIPETVERLMCLVLGTDPGTFILQEKNNTDFVPAAGITAEDMDKLTRLIMHELKGISGMIEEIHDSIGVVRKSVNANKIQLECVKKYMYDISDVNVKTSKEVLGILNGAVISKEPSNIAEAKQLLADLVGENGCEENAIFEEAQRRRIRKKDVQHAKGELGIITAPRGYGVNAKKVWMYG